MNFTNFIEYVQQHHSSIGDKEIRLLLNQSGDDFCRRSEIFRPTFSIASVAGQRYYQLPATPIKVIKVQVNDVEIPRLIGDPIIDDDEYGVTATDVTEDDALSTPTTSSDKRYWFINLDRLAIVESSTNAITRDGKTSNYQSMSESGKEITIYSISTPTHLTNTDSYTTETKMFSDLPTQFHDALLWKVIAYLYMDPPALAPDAAAAFDSRYMELVNEAKKFAKSNKTRGGYINPVYF